MGDSQERPRAGAQPQLNGDVETLQFLLDAEKRHLETALKIERDRSIVFPETSVIIHDIQKLLTAIGNAERKAKRGR